MSGLLFTDSYFKCAGQVSHTEIGRETSPAGNKAGQVKEVSLERLWTVHPQLCDVGKGTTVDRVRNWWFLPLGLGRDRQEGAQRTARQQNSPVRRSGADPSHQTFLHRRRAPRANPSVTCGLWRQGCANGNPGLPRMLPGGEVHSAVTAPYVGAYAEFPCLLLHFDVNLELL